MNTYHLHSKVATAGELVTQFVLSDAAQQLLIKEESVGGFLEKLVQVSLWSDALRLVAYALPKRQAVWWACLCIQASDASLVPKEHDALNAAKSWVIKEQEEVRRAAFIAAENAGLASASACAALAAFWSGGSMAPKDAPVVLPADYLCQHAVACAALIAVTARPEQSEHFYRQFIEIGMGISQGKHVWPN